MMNRKYTHIFFDLDNTIWDFKSNSKLAMKDTFQYLGLGKQGFAYEEFSDIYEKINTRLWEEYRNKQIGKKDLTRNRFQLTFDSIGIKGVDPLEMNELYLKAMPLQTTLEKGARELIELLYRQGYRLFIITNGFAEVQHKKLVNADLESLFEKLFISEEVKTPKPDKKIFEYAVKSSNARKAKSLMIGDDWEVDILGALSFGMDAIYYDRQEFEAIEKCPQETFQNSCCRVNSLLAIQQILEK